MENIFTAIIEKDGDWFIAYCPEIPGANAAISKAIKNYPQRGIQVVGNEILDPSERPGFFAPRPQYSDEEQEVIKEGLTIYQELCSTCHSADGSGIEVGDGLMAPPLANSIKVIDHPDYLVKVILRGLVGPIEGQTYTGGFMTPMAKETNEWIAAVASYVRTSLGNEASLVTADFVDEVRQETDGHRPFVWEDLAYEATWQLIPSDDWKVTASHAGMARIGGTGLPFGAFTYEGWTSGENQTKDMWFQVELPEPVRFAELHFNSPPKRRGWGRDAPPPIPTCPASYNIEVSQDGNNWTGVTQGDCSENNVRIKFAPVKGKFLRITQTGLPKDDAPWKMEAMKIYAKKVLPVG